MAKTMAQIQDGMVVNLLWFGDNAPETGNLKDVTDKSVGIGDTYQDGKFYRENSEILSPREALARLQEENEALRSALDTIYQGVTQ